MSKVALVTGANQGLGLALVRRLCQQLDDAVVYLSARDRDRGLRALALLEAEGLEPRFLELDVTQDESVAAAATAIREHHGGIDIVISNAAARITPDGSPADQVAEFVETNNHGTYRMIEAFRPLLNDNASFLVVASSFGSLRHLPRTLWHRFDVDRMSLREVEQTMDEYAELVQKDEAASNGWPQWINIPSKIGQVASAKILARMIEEGDGGRGIRVNAVCPGLVDTDASRPWFGDMSGAQSPDEAARDVVWLATLPVDASLPLGDLVQHRAVIPFR